MQSYTDNLSSLRSGKDQQVTRCCSLSIRQQLWMGGFRPFDLLKTLPRQLNPLKEQQVVRSCNLHHYQSPQQAQGALSQPPRAWSSLQLAYVKDQMAHALCKLCNARFWDNCMI